MLHISKIKLEKIMAFTVSLENLIDQLGTLLLPYIDTIFKILNATIKLSLLFRTVQKERAQKNGDAIESEDTEEILLRVFSKLRKQYQTSLKRVIQIYKKYFSYEFPQAITTTFVETIYDNIKNLPVESSSSVSLVLKLFRTWSEHSKYIRYFNDFPIIISSIALIYSQRKIHTTVSNTANDILLNISECALPEKTEVDINIEVVKVAEEILKKNVSTLVYNIKQYLKSKSEGSKKTMRPDLKVTRILMYLSHYVEDSGLADEILLLFGPLMNSKYINKIYQKRNKDNIAHNTVQKNINIINDVLKIFCNFFKLSKKQELFYENILDLLGHLNIYAPREDVVSMVESLDLQKFNISKETIDYIKRLNTYNRLTERGLNYGEIATAAYDINTRYLFNCSFEDQELILSNYMLFLAEEEVSIRMAATTGFKTFFEIILEQFNFGNLADIPKKIKWITTKLIRDLVFGLKDNNEYAVKSHLETIDFYVYYLNQFVKKGLKIEEYKNVQYMDLKLLQNKTDLNQDFFDNIFDVQNYKRIKAIGILTKRLKLMEDPNTPKEEMLSNTTLRNIILPVLKFQILSKHLQEDVLRVRGPAGDSQMSHAKNLVTQMIECHSLCVKFLPWSQYFNVLKAHVNLLNQNDKYEKVVVRLLCSNLNYLDAGLPNIVETVNNEMKKHQNNVIPKGLMEKLVNYEFSRNRELDNDDAIDEELENPDKIEEEKPIQTHDKIMEVENVENKEVKDVSFEEMERQEKEKEENEKKINSIIQHLRKIILNPLKRHMHDLSAEENKEKKIRVYTAVAIAKLVCRFPFHLFNIEYPRLIHNICENLKSRDYDIRNNSRKALSEIMMNTGPYFFHYIVREMSATLLSGYQKHILNYTLYFLLHNLIVGKDSEEARPNFEIGSLDYCLESILPIFTEEILGKLHEEKEAEEIKSKIPEYKTSKAYDGFYLLATVIDFKRTVKDILLFLII